MEQNPQNLEKLVGIKKFLIEANKAGYGSGEERVRVKESDGSTTIRYENKDGHFSFHDNYFGGEPYGGREVIFDNNKPVWMMVYYGEVSNKEIDKNAVYSFLGKALLSAPDDLPVRGPLRLAETIEGREWVYDNTYTGDLERFKGRETISLDGQQIYDADYSGGLVDVTQNV